MGDNYDDTVSPYFSTRSMSVNLPRMRSGWTNHTHKLDIESFNATLAIGGGYSQSFNNSKITRCLFGNSLHVQQILNQLQ